MLRYAVLFTICIKISRITPTDAVKQQLQLSDSYLPVAMQVIAHLTDQMAYEAKDEVTTSKPTARPTVRPTVKPTVRPTVKPTVKPTTSGPLYKPTTSNTYVAGYPLLNLSPVNGWWMSIRLTTPFHKPGLYAPVFPPPHAHRGNTNRFVLLPIDHNDQYTVIQPEATRTEEPLLSIQDEEIKPLMENTPKGWHLLPPNFDSEAKDKMRSSDEDEFDEENLQYLSPNVQNIIKMANDRGDDRVVDVWDGVRARPMEPMPTTKLSTSNLRLLLLYDLLSREAKRQRLSDYSGFSPDVMRTLVDSSSGGARAQLSLALSKMVERKDCQHDYANNRAKEIVLELAKDESKISSELRYLQPLVYKL